jgi:hypothetical protein
MKNNYGTAVRQWLIREEQVTPELIDSSLMTLRIQHPNADENMILAHLVLQLCGKNLDNLPIPSNGGN